MTSNNETTHVQSSTALAVRDPGVAQALVPTTIGEAMSLSAEISKSSLVDAAYRAKQADVLHIVLAGQELGLPPMAALRLFYIEKGKPQLYADGAVAIVMGRRDTCRSFRLIESTDKVATFETVRNSPDGPQVTRMSYTVQEAQAANLLEKPPWRANRAAMLRARCKSALAKTVYPDLLGGVRIVEDDDDSADAAYVAPPPPSVVGNGKASPASVAAAQVGAEMAKADTKKAAAKKKEAPPPSPPPDAGQSDVIDVEYTDQPSAPSTQISDQPFPSPPSQDKAQDGDPAAASGDDGFGDDDDSPEAGLARFKSDLAAVKPGPAVELDLAKVKQAWASWAKRDDVKAKGIHLQMTEAFKARKAELA